MDNNTLSIYVHELRNLCDHSIASFDIFNQATRARNGVAMLYAGQVLLGPISQMAALLWPTRARARGRGEALRKALGLKEQHVLNDRRMTELWERHDERLEDWINRTKGDQVVFDYVGDLTELRAQDGTPVKQSGIYRAFDPNTRIYHFRGVGYNLQALADAISDLQARIWAVYRRLFPEQAKAEEAARRQAIQRQQEAQAEGEAKAGDAEAPAEPATDKAEAPTPAPSKKPVAKKAPAKKATQKPATAKTGTKKPAAKKTPTTQKAPAKKPAAKKAAAKKEG